MTVETQDQAFACTLTDEEFRDRRAWVREQVLSRATRAEENAAGARLVFPKSDEMTSMLETWASLERDCCDFLTFTIADNDSSTVLSITGPPEAVGALKRLARKMDANELVTKHPMPTSCLAEPVQPEGAK